MKKFVKKNRIISIFGLISILIAVSYAVTYNMPDYFGIEGWYSQLNNISISYIAALIFYILQVYKPECENSKRAHMVLEPLFLELLQFIEVTIACCRKYVSIDEDGKIIIDWTDKEGKVIYFVPVVTGSDVHRPAIRKEKTDLIKLQDIYKSKIQEIKEKISFKECDPDIINSLSNLEASDFFKSVIATATIFEGTFIKFAGFQDSVDKFEIIKDEFKACCGITCKYEVRNAEEMEIAACETIFYRNALQATTVDEFNETTYREFLRLKLKPLIADEDELNQLVNTVLSDIMISMKIKK